MAGAYPCDKVDLLAFMTLAQMGTTVTPHAADIWGWTDPETNREYALVGRTDGTTFVDVTDPSNPRFLHTVRGGGYRLGAPPPDQPA